jgi:hypothetical protein
MPYRRKKHANIIRFLQKLMMAMSHWKLYNVTHQ